MREVKNSFRFDENLSDEDVLIELIDFYASIRAQAHDIFFEKAEKHISAERLQKFEETVRPKLK